MQTNTRPFFVLAFSLIISSSALGQSSASRQIQIAAATQVQKQVSQLTDLVAAQQRQLETQGQQLEQLKKQLQQLLDTTQQANAIAQKGQSNADQAQTAASQAQHAADEAQRIADQASANAIEAKTALAVVNTKTQDEDKELSALQDVLGRFRLSGDVRVRGEGFYQDNVISRNRARIRARLGLDGKLN